MIKKLQLVRFSFFCVFVLFAFVSQINAQCEAGDLQTTGTVMAPTGTSYDLMVTNAVVPTGGGQGWIFDNSNSDGSGALGGLFIFFGQTGTETFDDDLNGLLSTNNYPPFYGTWVIKGAAYTDPNDAFNTVCSTTADSLIVIFGEAPEITCNAGQMQTTGSHTVCSGVTFDLETANDTIPASGGIGWLFLTNGTGTGGNGASFILPGVTGMDSYDETLNGAVAAMGGTWVAKAATYSTAANPGGSICSVSEDSLILTFNPELTSTIVNNGNTSVSAAPVGGVEPYTYLWSNGETTQTATNLMDGSMSCTVTDVNGCEVTESIDLMNTAVEDIVGLLNYELSPNPTSGFTTLELNFVEAQAVKINIVGMDGKILQTVINERTVGGIYNLDMTTFNTGIYLVHITTETGHFAERLFVK